MSNSIKVVVLTTGNKRIETTMNLSVLAMHPQQQAQYFRKKGWVHVRPTEEK